MISFPSIIVRHDVEPGEVRALGQAGRPGVEAVRAGGDGGAHRVRGRHGAGLPRRPVPLRPVQHRGRGGGQARAQGRQLELGFQTVLNGQLSDQLFRQMCEDHFWLTLLLLLFSRIHFYVLFFNG